MTAPIQELTDAQTCTGISVRTTNTAEISHETAKLGKLWQSFYKNHVSQLEKGEDIYGIYHNYESDDVGAFDVVASWKVSSQQDEQVQSDNDDTANPVKATKNKNASNLVTVSIPAGKYMVFYEYGNMPNTVMNAWEKAWTYFNNPSCEHTRTYNVDFERYVEGKLEYGQVELYIGIE
ncbi:GyrI-like domain-containing protein [Psychrobacter sp. DAB_AL32B]|uniref:GyrI-like domain-containing protein n=1 Tax=Psychrobacter sp. DAB_AL32B TaxID=1028414 RepID=UPI000B7CE13D|nr:GyrI-like domain-containing protein [Psychrobacter sp. DAB_AL32B]OXL17509.1 AraC family transcriptional regulator [Psychrobacter sp. DAB_AL32B]